MIGSTESPGLDLTGPELSAVANAMTSAGLRPTGPLVAQRIGGGRSNLTYALTDGAGRWVLRTPPRVGRTPSAHDIAREHRVTAALAATDIPVARPLLLCDDEAVLGVPFTLAEFVAGSTLQTRADLNRLTDAQLTATVDDLVRTLAALHRIDYRTVGLAGFGRPDAYAERQLRRWSGQWQLVGSDELRPLAEELMRRLGAGLPGQRRSGIVHGDYRIDNTIVAPRADGELRVAAVVDWELSTLGDPVADVAMMCAYRDPALDLIVGAPGAWTSERIAEATALAEAYERAGGVPLMAWEFHLALAYFKIGVIAAGIDYRRRSGGARGPGFDRAGESVQTYLELGLSMLGGPA